MFGNVAFERQCLEMTYGGLCAITEFKTVKNGTVSEQQEIVIAENQPCAISQTSLRATTQTETTNNIDYDVKLFIAPEIEITAGCKIHVVQNGMDCNFEQAGEPFIYPTHQEVKLKRVGKA